jgi:septal ring factor EnvC (AmiA/AmiB activator)
VSGVLLSVVALAAIVASAIFFWPSSSDPRRVSATNHVAHVESPPKLYDASKYDADSNDRKGLRDIQAAQQQTTSGKKTVNDSLATEDQFSVLAARLSELQNAMTQILRDNAELAKRLKETQAQMAQYSASVAEQLKALTPIAHHNASAAEKLEQSREHMADVFAKDSEESLRPQTPLSQPSATPAIPKRRQNVMRNWF